MYVLIRKEILLNVICVCSCAVDFVEYHSFHTKCWSVVIGIRWFCWSEILKQESSGSVLFVEEYFLFVNILQKNNKKKTKKANVTIFRPTLIISCWRSWKMDVCCFLSFPSDKSLDLADNLLVILRITSFMLTNTFCRHFIYFFNLLKKILYLLKFDFFPGCRYCIKIRIRFNLHNSHCLAVWTYLRQLIFTQIKVVTVNSRFSSCAVAVTVWWICG